MMRRRFPPRLGWIASALACAVTVSAWQPAAADQFIFARGWTHKDYGRLVLDSGSEELRDINVAGDLVVIRFKRPVKVDMAAALGNLGSYLLSASPEDGNEQLTLRLRPGLDHRQFNNNGNLVFDFAPASEKKFAPGKTAVEGASDRPATAPAMPQTASVESQDRPAALIQPRSGEHGKYSRLAFDLPAGVSASMRNETGQTIVQLSGPASLDLVRLQRRLPQRVQSIAARMTPDGQILDLQLKPGVEPRGIRQGRTVVLDFFDAGKAPVETQNTTTRLPPAPATEEAGRSATAFAGLEPLVALPGAPLGTAKENAVSTVLAPPPVPANASPVPANASPAPAAASPVTASQPSGPAPGPTSVAASTPAPSANPADVPVTVAPGTNGGAIVSFQWPSAPGVAAFKRGNALWIVFGAPARFAGKNFDAPPLAALGRAEAIDSKYAAGFRLVGSAANLPAPVLNRSGNTWIVELNPGQGKPVKNLPQRRETLAQGGASLLLQADRPGPVVSLLDPVAGDQLLIAPLAEAGLGVAEQAAWPEFKLLASYQGVAVAPSAGNVAMQTLPNGVVITAGPAAKPAPPPVSANGAGPIAAEAPAVPAAGLFDLPAWRRGGNATFLKDRDDLEEAITESSPTRRGEARLRLAEFLFAHGLVTEATGMLNIISDERSAPLTNKQMLTLAGAAHVLNGDLDEAEKLLNDPLVGSSPEASLFRGILAAARGDNEAASRFFNEPLPNLRDYPKPLRTQLGLTITRTLIEGGNPMASQAFADAMRADMPDAETTDRLNYLDGLRQLKMGKEEEAYKTWAALHDSPVEDVKAESQFAIINEKLRSKKMTPAEAIEPLEALRFLSRGGGFEFALLRKLGEVYLAADQPRRGLLTLRQAVTNFASRPESKDVAQEMTDAFRNLYLEGGADRLSPLTSVALYDEFRELTPSGPDGDRMIAGLADRLVKVDLLDGAANLLGKQVKHRLSGVDKARAGARLAAIRLLDNKPELADQALKTSQVADELPPDLVARRRQLQAQADFGLGQTLKALKEIEGDDSLSARWLRADMLWQLQEWPAAADALGQVVDGEETQIAEQAAAIMAQNNVALDPAAALREPPVQSVVQNVAQTTGTAAAGDTADDTDQAPAGAATFTDVMERLRNQAFKDRLGRVVLNRAVAMSLAGDRSGLRALARQYGKNMAQTNLAKSFTMLTSPSNGLADSVSAEMASVDQISSFVDEYRVRLRQASLSDPTGSN